MTSLNTVWRRDTNRSPISLFTPALSFSPHLPWAPCGRPSGLAYTSFPPKLSQNKPSFWVQRKHIKTKVAKLSAYQLLSFINQPILKSVHSHERHSSPCEHVLNVNIKDCIIKFNWHYYWFYHRSLVLYALYLCVCVRVCVCVWVCVLCQCVFVCV